MPNAPSSVRPLRYSSGISASRSIRAPVDASRQNSRSRARNASPRSTSSGCRRRVRVDQAQVEAAEVELLGEARPGPLGLAGGLGDLTGLPLGDLGGSASGVDGSAVLAVTSVLTRAPRIDWLHCYSEVA